MQADPVGRLCPGVGDGGKLTLPTRKDRLLLAYLALSAGKPQARDQLAGLLWGDRAETQARDSLKQALAGIRQAFRQAEPRPVRADRETIALEAAGIEIDAVEFARLATDPPTPVRRSPSTVATSWTASTPCRSSRTGCSRSGHVSQPSRSRARAARARRRDERDGRRDDPARPPLARPRPLCEPVYRALMRLLRNAATIRRH